MEFRPLHNRVAVKRIDAKEKSADAPLASQFVRCRSASTEAANTNRVNLSQCGNWWWRNAASGR
jgi:co-chaperonin GroES (HSP10)